MADAVADRQKDLDKVMDELTRLQTYYDQPDPDTKRKRRWDPEDRKKFEELSAEGFEIQQEIEIEQKFQELEAKNRQLRDVPEPSLPNARSQYKSERSDMEVAGYISLGDAVLGSDEFRKFAAGQYARGSHAIIQLAAAIHGKNVIRGYRGESLVPLTRSARKEYEKFMQTKEMKAVPTVGVGVIEPERISRIPQVTADERLNLRDVISTGQTGAGSVEYVREEAMTGSAAPTAHGQEKPELSVEYTLQAAPVRTIAGWMPVQNQQLEDWAQLRSLIDGRLRYSVRRNEEEQVFYGDGLPPNIEGILQVDGVQNIAANGRYDPTASPGAGHTLIDAVRMGITDVLVAGYQANAVAIHPIDWETIVLTKGTDQRYVWVVVTDNNGSRIWGVQVVETIGAQSRETGERNLIVGDWQMGAQLLDRMQVTVQVGLIDRQLIENMRTILAEERIALPVYAPAAFARLQTEAAGS